MRSRRILALAFASLWSRALLVRCFPLDLFNLALDTTSHAEFENDEHAFRFAVKWQALRISSSSSSSTAAAPFVGCADYVEGRRARIRLERMFGVGAVRTVHHSREHGWSCFLFHALHEEARGLLKEGRGTADGGGQLQYVAAFPANLKVAPNVLDFSSGFESSTKTSSDEVSSELSGSANSGGSRRLSGKSSGRLIRNSSKLTAAEIMHSDMLVKQKKVSFYSASSKAKNARAAKVGSEVSLPQRPRVHIASPWETVYPKLRVKPHEDMHRQRARGLGLQLSPGALGPPRHHASAHKKSGHKRGHKSAKGDLHSGEDDTVVRFEELVETWRDAWTSLGRTELHRLNIWSDPDADYFQMGTGGAGGSANKVFRSTEWRLAADKLDQLTMDTSEGFGAACGWDAAVFRLETSQFISVTGIDSLLNGSHLPGKSYDDMEDDMEDDVEDLRVACFMGLLSMFASAHEVLRISPLPRPRTHNAVASAITESGTITQEPFRDLGLNGSGEVVQVVDTGLDELSCFFIDQTGAVEHSTMDEPITDLDRRKVVQYIEYPSGDGNDGSPGHGTHVASSIAGEVFKGWTPSDCVEDYQKDCFGVCKDAEDITSHSADEDWDLNLYCEDLNCDGGWVEYQEFTTCLEGGSSDAPLHGGVARGAKIAFFDVSGQEDASVLDVPYPNAVEVWQAAASTGAAIHSNSWGYYGCVVGDSTFYNDRYSIQNPEHLLVFAAGNQGDASTDLCSITTPATGKNSLAVGSSSSGITRFAVGRSIDEVSGFSGRGPLADGRIKPDVVAPGDMVISARSSGYSGERTCQLDVRDGTSMSTPIVAGALAIVRQYFRQGWYTADVTARDLCGATSKFNCSKSGQFVPSGALLKAVMVHGADPMGGSSSPDGSRGFGRVLLEGSLPVKGEGSTTMYFDDSAVALAMTTTDYVVTVTDLTVEVKATLVWMDPPVLTFVGRQLLHDLDLMVFSSTGSAPMYSNGLSECCDTVNNVERVVVPVPSSPSVGTREYTVRVVANELVDDDQQAYSLIISGGFLNVTSITAVNTINESLIGRTDLPTSAPTGSPTPLPEPPRLSVDGNIANNCTDSDAFDWIGDGWCDSVMNNEGCYFDGGDCCADTCVDNTFTCGVTGYVCEDSASPSKLFCMNETQQETVGGASSAMWGDELDGNKSSSANANATAAWNETRAYVCANCDPAMQDFFYTIGDGICDDWSNVASCAFDGGDCCQDTCTHADCQNAAERRCFDTSSTLSLCGTLDPKDTDYEYNAALCRECPAFASELGSFIGDGFCDPFVEFNSPECFFDGGDCCVDTCKNDRWTCPEENSESAYVCLDPASSSYLCGHLLNETGGVDSLCETCAAHMGPNERFQIGDGVCDIEMNVEGCSWDAGDCCQNTCRPDRVLFTRAAAATTAPTTSPTAPSSSSRITSPSSFSPGSSIESTADDTSPSSTAPPTAPPTATPTALPTALPTAPPTALISSSAVSPVCDDEASSSLSGAFECFDCAGEAVIYVTGQALCLDPTSPDYACGEATTSATPNQGALCDSCDRSLAFDWPLVGNGGCQSWLNNEGCLWDGGDCCEATCVEELGPRGQTCGSVGYNCRAPTD